MREVVCEVMCEVMREVMREIIPLGMRGHPGGRGRLVGSHSLACRITQAPIMSRACLANRPT